MYYKNIDNLPKIKKANPYGRYEANEEKAKSLGIRYKKVNEIKKHWFADPGIEIPSRKFIKNAKEVYNQIVELYKIGKISQIMELEYKYFQENRKKIKQILELGEEYKIMLDANGSIATSAIAKIFRNEKKPFAISFSDQGRLMQAAIGYESQSIIYFVSNFEQQYNLFGPPYPKQKIQQKNPPGKNVLIIDIFNKDLTYKSDAQILEDYYKILIKFPINISLILHVSRTGRILPVEDLIKITKEISPQTKVFVDGAQAIGRISYEKIKHIISLADGYLIVGHKALGSLVSGAYILKEEIEKEIEKRIEQANLFSLKLFRFESEKINEKIIVQSKKEKRPIYLVSLPEVISFVDALEDNSKNFWNYQKIICENKKEIIEFLNNQPGILFNYNRYNSVDSIISFHLVPSQKGFELKDYLQKLHPPITIAPLTENCAIRIGINPKRKNLNESIKYLIENLKKFFNS
jgi:hypothetical protein